MGLRGGLNLRLNLGVSVPAVFHDQLGGFGCGVSHLADRGASPTVVGNPFPAAVGFGFVFGFGFGFGFGESSGDCLSVGRDRPRGTDGPE